MHACITCSASYRSTPHHGTGKGSWYRKNSRNYHSSRTFVSSPTGLSGVCVCLGGVSVYFQRMFCCSFQSPPFSQYLVIFFLSFCVLLCFCNFFPRSDDHYCHLIPRRYIPKPINGYAAEKWILYVCLCICARGACAL